MTDWRGCDARTVWKKRRKPEESAHNPPRGGASRKRALRLRTNCLAEGKIPRARVGVAETFGQGTRVEGLIIPPPRPLDPPAGTRTS